MPTAAEESLRIRGARISIIAGAPLMFASCFSGFVQSSTFNWRDFVHTT